MQHKKLKGPIPKQSQMIQDAMALHQAGQWGAAEAQYRTLLKLLPSNAGLLSNLGVLLLQKGQLEDGVKMLVRSVHINPNQPSALNNCGVALQGLNRLDEALVSFDCAIALNPDDADVYSNRGNILQELNRLDEALVSYEHAIALNSNCAEVYSNYGHVLNGLKRLDEAMESHDRAIALNPDYAGAHSNRGNVLKDLKRLDEAVGSYDRALALKPDIDFILGTSLHTKMQFCLWDDLPHLLNELTHKINNDEKVVMPLSLLALLDDPALHRKTTGIYVNEKCPQNHVLPKIDRYPRHAKIKIGYFSADFRDHPVAMLTAELYETHDRNQFEIYAFSFGRDTKDDMNLRIKAGVDHFHEAHYLKLDCSKAKARLNWVPKWRLEMALDKIIGWQKQYQQGADMREVTLEQIGHYTKHGIESAA